jgi:hypothetical protein
MVWGFCYLRIFKKVQSISGRSLECSIGGYLALAKTITQVCTDFDVCIKLTVFEQFRPLDYENDFGFALSRLVFSQIVFS